MEGICTQVGFDQFPCAESIGQVHFSVICLQYNKVLELKRLASNHGNKIGPGNHLQKVQLN